MARSAMLLAAGILLQLLIFANCIESSVCSWPREETANDDDIIRASPVFSERLKLFRLEDYAIS